MIYFDNSATTNVCQESAEKVMYMMSECWGNPSSLHSFGYKAEKELSAARSAVAAKLSAEPREIYFTSGGTEANNLAVLGAAEAKKRFGNRIVTTAIEHASVLSAMEQLEKQGFEVIYLKPDATGVISVDAINEAINNKTILVSMMSVNNETGAIMPLKAVAAAIKRKKSPALFHVDNVQGFGKIKLQPKKIGINLMTVSSHKVHGPKGAGALFIAQGTRIASRQFGGGQEKTVRPGTEAVPALCGFGAAVKALPEELAEERCIREIHDALLAELKAIPEIIINSPEEHLPYILNFSCGKIRSETMLHFLETKEIYVSSGSACAGGKASHVLDAMGLPNDRIDSSMRVSFSRFNTIEQVKPFIDALKEGLDTLAHR